jgi:hypothetical protein
MISSFFDFSRSSIKHFVLVFLPLVDSLPLKAGQDSLKLLHLSFPRVKNFFTPPQSASHFFNTTPTVSISVLALETSVHFLNSISNLNTTKLKHVVDPTRPLQPPHMGPPPPPHPLHPNLHPPPRHHHLSPSPHWPHPPPLPRQCPPNPQRTTMAHSHYLVREIRPPIHPLYWPCTRSNHLRSAYSP